MSNRQYNSRKILFNNVRIPFGTNFKTTALYALIIVGLILALAGCGGGGGGGSTGGNSGGSGQTGPVSSQSAFKATLYPVVVNHCGACHASNGPAGTPDFAHEDVATAFNVVETNTLVNLGNPSNSRLVQKLVQEKHQCGSNCTAWEDEMTAAIQKWANLMASNTSPTAAIESSTLTLADSMSNQSGGRVEDAIIAKYEFKTGSGTTAFDTSGVAPALNLTLDPEISWIGGQGIAVADPNGTRIVKALGSAADSKKLYDRIAGPTGTKQYTIEAWLFNDSLMLTGPARIVSYSTDATNRNFAMAQVNDYYNFRNRSNLTGNNGASPALETDHNAGDLKQELQHVVMTFDETNGRNIYINGQKVAYDGVTSDPAVPADISNWNSNYQLVLANEVSDGAPRQWLGKLYFVAIHERALTPTEIKQNTLAGLGQNYELQFDISDLVDPSGGSTSTITMLVRELDDSSYVFATPTLNTNMPSPNIPVKNIRIAVNGIIPAAAQAFSSIDTTVTASPTELSRLGAVIPKDLGPSSDRFTLEFEVLGSNSNIIVEPTPKPTVDNSVNTPATDSGLRTFEQINNTMSNLTGVSTSVASSVYDGLVQQLPSTPDLGSFVSANQVGITKLALEYCDALVNSSTLRSNFFGNTFEFGSAVSTAFSSQAKKDIIINSLVNNLVGTNLSSQPSLADLKPDLDQLLNELTAGCNVAADCDATRTRAIVKGACASVLSSAAVSIN